MKRTDQSNFLSLFFLLVFLFGFSVYSQPTEKATYDLVILGGTPGGIMAAIAANRDGFKSLIIERNGHIGGLPANGLGATDIKTEAAVGGLFKEFIGRVEGHYISKYGKNSSQHKISKGGYRFEPSVAESVLTEMLKEHELIDVWKNYQFDVNTNNISIENRKIQSIIVFNRITGESKEVSGKIFIDATYEGDLIAAAGVEYVLGRESRNKYNERYAGKIYKYWGGPVGKGSTFEADDAIQAYNYRLCLTKDPENRIEIEKPEEYNREDYVSLIDDVLTGRNTSKLFQNYKKKNPDYSNKTTASVVADKPKIPGNPDGIQKVVNLVDLPNSKTDANNQHLAFISTDLPEENWPWPEADWEWRDNFAKRLKNYTLGLLWFAQNDEELPEWFRQECIGWGLAADEYVDNENFPRQVYVREGRRMKGQYFYTGKDVKPTGKNRRPPVHEESISAGHYSIDSHGVRKREPNRVHLDGFLSDHTEPFTIPYGVMVPKEVDNLLAPVPVSGSHLGFSTLRMEPTWMALGHAAGIAAATAIETSENVSDINIERLQLKLLRQGAVLMYFEDIDREHPAFFGFQLLGLKGIYDGWYAKPDKKVSRHKLREAIDKLGLKIENFKKNDLSRSEFAQIVFNEYFSKQLEKYQLGTD
ncbi:FAD-dependent oxidoreductase [Gramella lutea]|uniref:FAD-dependent oxidoreductase n=1 Tax=Christiangramia lutea TaxID=1607951 RepID=A0A9X1V5P5_9FLAO|nr:FAD-dependent oxidoreductase [Christiangramia lutea]MCH4824151.1 FAD-dependent oxidoreductase [Christiangramia lutea]